MQGTAADIIKISMLAIEQWIAEEKLSTRIILQVHDELVFEVPKTELDQVHARVPSLMCEIPRLSVPLRVELGTGQNWADAHS